jgi:hypothetical protein
MDNAGYNLAVAGSQFSVAGQFAKLTFAETSGADNTITFDASDTPSPGRAIVVSANASTFAGALSGQYDVGNASVLGFPEFPGVDSAGRERKIIYITNTGRRTIGGASATDVVNVIVNGAYGGAVYPQTTVAFETNGDIELFGGLIDLSAFTAHLLCYVLEVFYSKPLQTDQ